MNEDSTLLYYAGYNVNARNRILWARDRIAMAQGAWIVERDLDRKQYDEVTGPFRQRPGVAK